MRFSRLSSKESQNLIDSQLFFLGNALSNGLYGIEEVGNILPGSVMVQDLSELRLTYMNSWGCEKLDHSLEELNDMGQEYYQKFFYEEESRIYLPGMLEYCKGEDRTSLYQFYQRVKTGPKMEPEPYFTSCRLIQGDIQRYDSKKLVLIATPVSGLGITSGKLSRILNENVYATKHYRKFQLLTTREKEIIALLAEGKSSAEIAEILFISIHTVTTHRKNITAKLDINSFAGLIRFANAFDLISY